MNTVRDLRQALSDEVRRLQAPVGLEARVLQEALGSRAANPPRSAFEQGAGRPWQSRGRPPFAAAARALGAIAAVLIVVLIVVGTLLGGRMLRDQRTVPAHPLSHAAPRATPGMVSATAGWQGGFGLPLLRTTDGGLHWSDVSPPSDCCANVTNTYFLDANHAWFAADLTIHRTSDGGKTWEQSAEIPNSGNLYFLDATHGWMLTTSLSPMGADALYGTSDGGLHWTVLATHLDSDQGCNWLMPVAFASPTDGWLPVSDCASQSLLVTHDGGVTWSPQQLPLAEAGLTCPCTTIAVTTFDRNHAAVLAAGNAFPAQYQQRLFTTADGGSSWTQRVLPGETQLMVNFIDPMHGWTVAGPSSMFSRDSSGHYPNLPGVTAPLYRTEDGGRTWVPLDTHLPLVDAGGQLSDLYFVDLKHAFAERLLDRGIGLSQVPQLLASDDAGRTWTVVGPYA